MNRSVPTRDELGACSCCGWNESDAEDVLQTAYVKVISGRARYEGRSAFRTWLFGVIRYTAREYRRRRKARHDRAGRLALEVAAEGGASVEPQDSLEHEERGRVLRAALAKLPDRQREVVHLVFYQDLTVQEAADVMEVSIGSARVHYDRAKKRLRALLDDARSGGDL